VPVGVSYGKNLNKDGDDMKRVLMTIGAALAIGGAALFFASGQSTVRAAIRALERARNHMEHAAHDFGGHRKEAMAATDEAIKQLRIALQYDRD
jgi:O-acetylhomoserine/O-acetylserine sulfhydrylase-like pyridoxal-dependent enzyme